MELLLTNCSKCHKLMIRSVSRTICKKCFLERTETDDAAAETDEPADDEQATYLCQNCGAEMDTNDKYCVRCQLRLMDVARSAVSELSDKLKRFPELRGSAQSSVDKSRFYSRETGASGPRDLNRRASRSYTPSTKYSS